VLLLFRTGGRFLEVDIFPKKTTAVAHLGKPEAIFIKDFDDEKSG
jgi:hypothetical protein